MNLRGRATYLIVFKPDLTESLSISTARIMDLFVKELIIAI